MSKDMNIFSCTGRLTRDSELTYTNTGAAICKFSLAYTRNIKKNDQWQDKSCYINCVLWGKRGEALNQYLNKGQQVAINGELDFETWEKDGIKRSKHSLIVDNVVLTGGKKEGYAPQETGINDGGGSFEDDIPF